MLKHKGSGDTTSEFTETNKNILPYNTWTLDNIYHGDDEDVLDLTTIS